MQFGGLGESLELWDWKLASGDDLLWEAAFCVLLWGTARIFVALFDSHFAFSWIFSRMKHFYSWSLNCCWNSASHLAGCCLARRKTIFCKCHRFFVGRKGVNLVVESFLPTLFHEQLHPLNILFAILTKWQKLCRNYFPQVIFRLLKKQIRSSSFLIPQPSRLMIWIHGDLILFWK